MLPSFYRGLPLLKAGLGLERLTIELAYESWPASPFVFDMIPLLVAADTELE